MEMPFSVDNIRMERAQESAVMKIERESIGLNSVNFMPPRGIFRASHIIASSKGPNKTSIDWGYLDLSLDDGTDGDLHPAVRALRFCKASSNISDLFSPTRTNTTCVKESVQFIRAEGRSDSACSKISNETSIVADAALQAPYFVGEESEKLPEEHKSLREELDVESVTPSRRDPNDKTSAENSLQRTRFALESETERELSEAACRVRFEDDYSVSNQTSVKFSPVTSPVSSKSVADEKSAASCASNAQYDGYDSEGHSKSRNFKRLVVVDSSDGQQTITDQVDEYDSQDGSISCVQNKGVMETEGHDSKRSQEQVEREQFMSVNNAIDTDTSRRNRVNSRRALKRDSRLRYFFRKLLPGGRPQSPANAEEREGPNEPEVARMNIEDVHSRTVPSCSSANMLPEENTSAQHTEQHTSASSPTAGGRKKFFKSARRKAGNFLAILVCQGGR